MRIARAGRAETNVQRMCWACRDKDVDLTWGACTMTRKNLTTKCMSVRGGQILWYGKFNFFVFCFSFWRCHCLGTFPPSNDLFFVFSICGEIPDKFWASIYHLEQDVELRSHRSWHQNSLIFIDGENSAGSRGRHPCIGLRGALWSVKKRWSPTNFEKAPFFQQWTISK